MYICLYVQYLTLNLKNSGADTYTKITKAPPYLFVQLFDRQ